MNLYKITPILLFLSAILIINACKKDKNPAPQPVPLSSEELFYMDCGKAPPVLGCIRGALLFIPNAFTPNNDGYNDVFYPFGMHNVFEVVSFKVFDDSGNLVYEVSNFEPNDSQYGWNGKHPDGSLQDGIFTYKVTYKTTLGETADFEGTVCSRTSLPINCVEHEKNITWGTQHNGNGGFASALPSYEDCE